MSTMTKTLVPLLAFATAASAQLLSNTVQATVPFSFSVPSGVLPAGTYRIEQPNTINGNRSIVVTDVRTRRSVLLINTFNSSRQDGAPAELEFRCAESRCELATIWLLGGHGLSFAHSRNKFPAAAYMVARIPLTPAAARAD
jgi:hypothetical protein